MKRNTMLTVGAMVGLSVIGVTGLIAQQERADDEAAITAAINGYIGSFYETNPELLNGAVHPNLKKRNVKAMGETQYLNEMTHSQLYALAAVANRGQWDENSSREIEIFDIELGIASAKLTVDDWIDLFHLAEINGKWQIVNVMWASKPPPQDG